MKKGREPSVWRKLILLLFVIGMIVCVYPNLKGCDNKIPSPPKMVPIA